MMRQLNLARSECSEQELKALIALTIAEVLLHNNLAQCRDSLSRWEDCKLVSVWVQGSQLDVGGVRGDASILIEIFICISLESRVFVTSPFTAVLGWERSQLDEGGVHGEARIEDYRPRPAMRGCREVV